MPVFENEKTKTIFQFSIFLSNLDGYRHSARQEIAKKISNRTQNLNVV